MGKSPKKPSTQGQAGANQAGTPVSGAGGTSGRSTTLALPAAPISAGALTVPLMQHLKGLPVSTGVAIGRVMIVDEDARRITKRSITKAEVDREMAKLDATIAAAIADVDAVYAQAEKEMGKETAQIFRAHKMMLKDATLLKQMRETISKELVTADYASNKALTAIADQFRNHPNSVFATKANDIEDLAIRLHRQFTGMGGRDLTNCEKDTIVVARDLTPSQTAMFDRTRIKGFVTDLGGTTSHTAIIAKALEIPAVVGMQTVLKTVHDGMPIVLDGDRGLVILNPDAKTLAEYERYIEQRRLYRVSLGDLADVDCVTEDGVKVQLVGNIELPEEASKVLKMGGSGIGLYRTEYLYLTGRSEPTEEDHFKAYKKCIQVLSADGVKNRELVIRTVDLGADKYTQSQAERPERNPFLGNRSIRYCLSNQPMFKRQLRALLRASALGPIKMMFPLISSITELRQAKFIVNDVMEELDEEGIAFDRKIKIGMMVEVPSAALLADTFAREVDFFSIGTNDLVQYTLAVDRINERVAALYQPTHPAVIKLIRDVARSARRHQTPVSCCGEAAGDLPYAMLLIGLGLRTLSVTSSAIPPLKRFIRSISVSQCERIAKQALSLDSGVQIEALLRDRARSIVPEAFDGRSAD